MNSYHQVLREQSGIPLFKDADVLQKEELGKQVAEISKGIKIQWLQEEPTQEFFKSISRQIESLETQARNLACAYYINNNHQEIIQLLIRAAELRNIKQTYGSVSSS